MKEVILSALLASAISGGGTYAVTQYRQPATTLDLSQLQAQAAESIRVQREILEALRISGVHQLNLDEHVVQIACLIKGCKPQAMR